LSVLPAPVARHTVSTIKQREEEFMRGTIRLLLSTAAVLVLTVGVAQAGEVKVLIAGALQNAVRALAADYEKQSGNQVTITATNPALVGKEFKGGQYDVVAAASPSIAELAEAAELKPGSIQHLARTGIGVAVKSGAPVPDLSTIAAFRRAVMGAKSIIYTDPMAPNASGGNTQRILINAGLLDEVKKKGTQDGLGPGREKIAKGEAQMGFFNVSESTAPGIVLAGPVPEPLQQYINYDIALTGKSALKPEAAAFAEFLTSKDARPRWIIGGMEQLPPE
jgi:molybdate transport system substrate-binding protein